MGNWFGKRRRGIIFCIWNSHTSVGNILGAVIAGVWVNHQWGYSFIVPGLMMMFIAGLVYLFVVVHPEDVGLPHPGYATTASGLTDTDAPSAESLRQRTVINDSSFSMDLEDSKTPNESSFDQLETVGQKSSSNLIAEKKKPIVFWKAVMIPGVWEFSLCLFFSKAVYYTFFFWLPVYIKETTDVGNHVAADLSAVFDAGSFASQNQPYHTVSNIQVIHYQLSTVSIFD